MSRRRPPALDRELRNQRKAFIKRFGREPLLHEPVFFDPDAPGDTPIGFDAERVRADTIAAMVDAKLAPETIYAFARTGYIMFEDRETNATPEARAEWAAAVEEYRRHRAKSATN